MLNLDNIKDIVDGDQELLNELLSTFFQATREDILNLHAAVNNHQTSLVNSLAHRIKGGAAMIGAEQLAELAGDIEHQTDPERYELLFVDLQRSFAMIESLYPDL